MKRTELKELGEFGLIDHLTKAFAHKHASTIKGVGDDAAAIRYASEGPLTLVSSDMLVEGIHFDLSYTPLKHLGYKAAVVNFSDIYAMNARPKQLLVNMALSNRFSVEAMEELYAGIQLACDIYGVDLVGGDTTSSLKGLVLSLTIMGEQAADKVVYRRGAKAGDLLCVTGHLGGAYLGLQLLEREKQIFMEQPDMEPDFDGEEELVGRLLKPEARQDIIAFFEEQKLVPTAMIDISDGLSSEALHLCKQSGLGLLLEEVHVPIKEKVYRKALDFNLDPLVCAMHGGEDYELLFCIDPKDADKIKYNMDISIIGEMVPAADGIRLQTKGGKLMDLVAQGWTHH
ncbi:thiamine-phosphate kinase [Saprospira sp. CCB-QB6]|uniref:thiamine-phosphate kinase n=1 Tax=Saprospira sp. CCB-QB6 TaxID=3023936 RepID=UPI00234BF29C|nr:thiamine-phosphate kinase [Saprospira sp. CCB-QB6]WCL80117.1 thiamine-phosphate kinase [Saprospira sp. CCB-QB6]